MDLHAKRLSQSGLKRYSRLRLVLNLSPFFRKKASNKLFFNCLRTPEQYVMSGVENSGIHIFHFISSGKFSSLFSQISLKTKKENCKNQRLSSNNGNNGANKLYFCASNFLITPIK
jgi:hypothetical protein